MATPEQQPLFAHLPGNMSAPGPAAQLLDHQPVAEPSAALAATAVEAELAAVSTMAAVAAAAAAAAAWRQVTQRFVTPMWCTSIYAFVHLVFCSCFSACDK